MTNSATLPAATDDNQLGAHLCHQWDKQRSAGMTHGKWAAEFGRFMTLEEWAELQEARKRWTLWKFFKCARLWLLLLMQKMVGKRCTFIR